MTDARWRKSRWCLADETIIGCHEQFVVDAYEAATGPEPTATPPTTSTEAAR